MAQSNIPLTEADILKRIMGVSKPSSEEVSQEAVIETSQQEVPNTEEDILARITGTKSKPKPIEEVKPEEEKPYTGAPMTQSAVLYRDEPIFLFGSPFIMPGASRKISTSPEDSMKIEGEEGITHYLQEARKPQKQAESVSDWLRYNLPNDLYYAPGGIASFFLHDLPKSFLDPIEEDFKRNRQEESIKESVDKDIEYTGKVFDATRDNLWGLLEFVTKPLGVYDIVEDTINGETIVVEDISPEELLDERKIGIKFNDDGTPKKVSFKLPSFNNFKESWNRNPVMSTLGILPIIKYGLAKRAMRDAQTETEIAEANVIAERALDEARALREEGDNIEKVKVDAMERIYETSKEAFETYKTEDTEIPFVQNLNKDEQAPVESIKGLEVAEDIKTDTIDSETNIVAKPLKHPEKSVFFQDEALTLERTKVLEDIAKEKPEMLQEDPMLYHQVLINEMNRWYHKLDDVDVELTRRKLSEYAAFVDELREDFPKPSETEGFDMFKDFKRSVVESAKWARRVQQKDGFSDTLQKPLPKDGEKFGTVSDIEFYMGVPVHKVYDILKGRYRTLKDKVIKSVNTDESAIINDIMTLHTKGKFDVDVTYSKGVIWDKLGTQPKHKFDKYPQTKDTIEADVSNRIPLKDESVESVFFDPPYLVKKTVGKKQGGMMQDRFTTFETIDDLWEMIKGTVAESARILKPGGVLAVKIQDVYIDRGGRGNYFTSAEVYNFAMQNGLQALDRFIYENKKGMPLPPNVIEQKHAKKVHSDYLLFKKPRKTSTYKYPKSGGVKLYSGIPIDEAYKKVKDYFDSVDAAKVAMQPSKKERIKSALKKANTKFWSQSHNLKKELTKPSTPEQGYTVLQSMVNSSNATSRSANMFRQFEREIWGDLSKEECKLLDRLIFARRTRQIIDNNPKAKHPGNMSRDYWQAYIENFAEKEGIPTDRARSLYEKTDAYFDIAKDNLKQLHEAGIIDDKTFESLSNFDYQRRQLIDIIDPLTEYHLGGSKISVRESGIQKLVVGSKKQLLETDARLLLSDLVIRTQNRIMANKTAVDMYRLAEADPKSEIVKIKTKDNKIPKGWHPIELYIDGKKTRMYMPEFFAKEWVTRNREITYELGRFARLVSGSTILRSMATGVNVGFALKNIFRDFAFMWIASQHYVKDVGWKSTYSPYIPVAMGQQLRDVASVTSDIIFRKGIYEDMVDQGVLLDFLSNKDRVMKERVGKDNPTVDTIIDAVHYLGTTSELLGRAALYKRALRKGLDKKEAAFLSKDYLHFGDYGTWTKAADTVIPYFGATMKATEGLYRAASRNPQEFALKAVQVMTLAATLHLINESVNPEAYAQVSKHDKERNFILPYYFKYTDKDGVERYMYFKIPKDQGQTFFATVGEYGIDKVRGKNADSDIIVPTLKNLSPIQSIPIPPMLDAFVGYACNIDTWTGNEIWNTTAKGKVGKGLTDLKEEYTNETHPGLVELGEASGLSPERVNYMLEAVFTRGNLYTDAFAGVTRELFSDMPDDQREMVIADMISQNSTLKGLIGRTDPLNQFRYKFEDNAIESDIERLVNNRTSERLVEQVFVHKSATGDDIKDFLRDIKDKDERDRIVDKMKFDKQIVDLPNKRLWRIMYGAGPEVAAKNFYDMFTSYSLEKKEELLGELKKVNKIRNLTTPAFKKAYKEEILKHKEEEKD